MDIEGRRDSRKDAREQRPYTRSRTHDKLSWYSFHALDGEFRWCWKSVALLLLFTSVVSCDGAPKHKTTTMPGSPKPSHEICDNGQDDDLDNFTDCEDSNCGLPEGCEPTWKEVATAHSFACGLTARGEIWCWGKLLAGQESDGRFHRISDGSLHFTQLDATWFSACAVTQAGSVYCWGDNTAGQLGARTDSQQTLEPVHVPLDATLHSVSVAASHTCALDTSGVAYCWGSNRSGQVGAPLSSKSGMLARTSPTALDAPVEFHTISASTHYSCGLGKADGLYCWGRAPDTWGEDWANLTNTSIHQPRLLDQLTYKHLKAHKHLCALDSGKGIQCWIRPPNWKSSSNAASPATPVSVRRFATKYKFIEVSWGDRSFCGVTSSGKVLCWSEQGQNLFGTPPLPGLNLTDSGETKPAIPEPIPVQLQKSVVSVQVSDSKTCAVLQNGALWCWEQASANDPELRPTQPFEEFKGPAAFNGRPK